ncbi:hypothetical protein N7491_005341 [Penicillium cf. griseofulvum]|nr:hypothetical protein N7491_005341 [Penicillium cf. griseofulvum]
MLEALYNHLLEKPGLYLDEIAIFLGMYSRRLQQPPALGRPWSPLGVAPKQVSQFHRHERYQILPAYAQGGIVLSRVFRGSRDASTFENFIHELRYCGRWLEPKSVLVMDNASFHHSERLSKMYVIGANTNIIPNKDLVPFSNSALIESGQEKTALEAIFDTPG